MNNKIKLLETAVKRISSEREFIYYTLNKYLEIEKISEETLLADLKCSLENYYKLALCKAPDANSVNFIAGLNEICEYANIPVLELNKIIKRVNTISKLSENINSSTLMMAARDKKKNGKKD